MRGQTGRNRALTRAWPTVIGGNMHIRRILIDRATRECLYITMTGKTAAAGAGHLFVTLDFVQSMLHDQHDSAQNLECLYRTSYM